MTQFKDKILNGRWNKFKNTNLKSAEMPFLCTQCPVVDEFGHSATRIAKTKQGIGKV